ncbi:MAG: hypothetical protein WCE90_05085 [Candidatus Zixiibacteriota bacterium]
MVGCIVLTHGDLCYGLKNTLEGIMGKQEGLSVLSNAGLGREELFSSLHQKISEEDGGDGVIIFVDMFGTSCWQAAQRARLEASAKKVRTAVIAGVNLPMLVKFFESRDSLSFDQLIPLIIQEGEKGVRAGS